jgi:methylase of polypeptide subunit release factors
VSSTHRWSGPLAADEPGAVEELAEVLRSTGYTGEAVRAALGVEGRVLARSVDVPVHRRRLAGLSPLGTIVTLFVLDAPVTLAAAKRAFAPIPLDRLQGLGLIEADGDQVHPRVRLVPHDDLLIASDRRERGHDQSPDHVAGVHGPSLTLSQLTVRRSVETALDVGTGCGVQAILASRHSTHVVATDLNERALNFAAFNAGLNGAGNIELRAGSFFEPIDGSRFELLVCNPPYVISPESAYLFRDSGLAGDTVSSEVVRRAPAALEDGAFGHILISWVHRPGGDWSIPLREWVEGSGCDALFLHYGTDDPLTHAANWTRDQFGGDPVAFDAALGRWLEYFERLEIEGIAYGGIILRRRGSGPNWVHAHELPADRLRPAGEHILRLFAAQDYLAALGEEREMLSERFALAERDLIEQRAVLHDGEWVASEIRIKLEEGLGFSAGIDPPTAQLLAMLDGQRTLGEVVFELADREQADRETLVASALGVVRGMLELGFLVRADPSSP